MPGRTQDLSTPLAIAHELGELSQGVKSLQQSNAEIFRVLDEIRSNGLSVCREHDVRLNTLQEWQHEHASSAHTCEPVSRGWVEVTKRGLKASGWPIIVLAVLAWMWMQQGKTNVDDEERLIRKTTRAVMHAIKENAQ